MMALMLAVGDYGPMTIDIYESIRQFLAAENERPAQVVKLTGQEQVVLRYLGGNQTLSEISSVLHVSTNTTKSHVRSIYRKLGVNCRRDAVRMAVH